MARINLRFSGCLGLIAIVNTIHVSIINKCTTHSMVYFMCSRNEIRGHLAIAMSVTLCEKLNWAVTFKS